MSNELQRYYVVLYKKTSATTLRYLRLNNMLRVESIMPWVVDETKEFNIRNPEVLYNLKDIVQKIRIKYRTIQEKELDNTIIHDFDNNDSALNQKFTTLLTTLSVRSSNVLLKNNIKCIKDLLPWIIGEKNNFRMFYHCGRSSSYELMSLVRSLRRYIIINHLEKEVDDSLSSTINTNEDNNPPLKTNNINKLPELQQDLLNVWIGKKLSKRAVNVLKTNELDNINNLLSWAENPLNTFLNLRNCGAKTKLELSIMLNDILKHDYNNYTHLQVKEIEVPLSTHVRFDQVTLDYANYYYDKYGHWPLFFLTLSYFNITKNLKERLFARAYGLIGVPESIETLADKTYYTIDTIKYILNNITNPQKNDFSKFFQRSDWKNYQIDNIQYIFPWENKVIIGDDEFENYTFFINNIYKDVDTDRESSKLSQYEIQRHETFCDQRIILQFLDKTLYWLDVDQCRIQLFYSIPSNSQKKLLIPIIIDNKFDSYKFNKAIHEVQRLLRVKTTENISIPIQSYFLDNDSFWKNKILLSDTIKESLIQILSSLFSFLLNATINNRNLIIQANKIDYGERLYKILKDNGERMHIDDILIALNNSCIEDGLQCEYTEASKITPYLSRNERIVPFGKSSYWGLKEWSEKTGSIREISIQIVQKSKNPIKIKELCKIVLKHRPDSNSNSVTSVIRQTTLNKELLLFFGDYIGLPNRKYKNEYIVMPQTFDEWLQAFKDFVTNNRRYPYSNNGFEGYLNRWYYRASQLIDLSSDEILKIDALERALTNYPHNTLEFKFLQYCNYYKDFVSKNNRMLTKEDDAELFKWFNNSSSKYTNFTDNRHKYFSQLLQYLSSTLY